jgi:hypothetical protein
MKLSAYKKLVIKDPTTAMIFDLTERFPRGPKAKLRKKHYVDTQYGAPKSTLLVGGEFGYDIFKLYELSKKSWYATDLERIKTDIEDCAMGTQESTFDYDTRERTYEDSWLMFKRGPQITRRIRRLEERLRAVKSQVEKTSAKNLYSVRAGGIRQDVYVFGTDDVHARQQFDLLLKSAFDAGCESGLTDASWETRRNDGPKQVDVRIDFEGPSHGQHEIISQNEKFVGHVERIKEESRATIEKMHARIAAAEDLAMMVQMYTMNTCAQQFGDAE